MDPPHACTVVLDSGSGTLRAGFGSSETPSLIMPSVVGRPRLSDTRQTAMSGKSASTGVNQDEIFFGDDVLANLDTLRRSYPLYWGLVQNWEDLTKLWLYVFEKKLERQMEETPLVVMESAYMIPKINREKKTEIAFETFNVPSFYLAHAPSAVLRAMGLDTGVVIDMGKHNVRVVPVYEGHYLPHTVMKFEIGGQNVTDSLQHLLSQQKGLSPVPGFEEVTLMKEKLAYVAEDYEEEMKTFSTSQERSYTLRSGDVLTLGQERFQCVEGLFQPSLHGMEMLCLAEHVVLTILKCSPDIRQSLLSNVFLVGGGSKVPGMATRLQRDVQKQLRGHEDPFLHGLHVQMVALPDGDLMVWKGGSRLVRVPLFADLCITKDDYDEYGTSIVHKKCC
ncbi:hypothetical protein ACOMHN_041839 [Nucella lapillus]